MRSFTPVVESASAAVQMLHMEAWQCPGPEEQRSIVPALKLAQAWHTALMCSRSRWCALDSAGWLC